MERFKEIKTIKTINIDTKEEEETTTTRNYVIKKWEDLTTEEKEKEIENNKEAIYETYQEDIYNEFKYDLEYIKEQYKDIDFNTIYIDSNSQCNWIDKVDKFKFYKSIEIYGETIEIYDIDLHIRRYIEEINENDINIYTYYLDNETLEKIQNTKKYKKFINEIINYINKWINEVNEACKKIMSKEYYYPYNLDDSEDSDYLDNYFSYSEFIYDAKE